MRASRARILGVDVEAAIRLALDVIFQHAECLVTTATSGEEALGWLMLSTFDLLLSELRLPGNDGLALARDAQKCQPSATILFITGSSAFGSISLEAHVGHFDLHLRGNISLTTAL